MGGYCSAHEMGKNFESMMAVVAKKLSQYGTVLASLSSLLAPAHILLKSNFLD
jgi:hypothetical protein